jgi:hypothetical protein
MHVPVTGRHVRADAEMDHCCQPHEPSANTERSGPRPDAQVPAAAYHLNVDMGVNVASRAVTRKRAANDAEVASGSRVVPPPDCPVRPGPPHDTPAPPRSSQRSAPE